MNFDETQKTPFKRGFLMVFNLTKIKFYYFAAE
jgi:hypothetical protein